MSKLENNRQIEELGAACAIERMSPEGRAKSPEERSPISEKGPDSRTQSRLSGKSNEEAISIPARRPYYNPSAVDNHVSESNSESEPTYENVARKMPTPAKTTRPNVVGVAAAGARDHELDLPVPPYMPMQQQNTRKSSSMEKRINKKKEKEGCKQQ